MTNNNYYKKQVELLLDVLPHINKLEQFALKGGTAINLFVQNMPRLSVDIDLTYIPIEPRKTFITNLTDSLNTLQKSLIEESNQRFSVSKILSKDNQMITKLLVKGNGVEIKVEPSLVFRGFVYPNEEATLCDRAQNEFLRYVKTTMVSRADLYAGKICAALNRQHPRDLFDIKLLLNSGGINTNTRKAFVCHVACDSRPIAELLNPNRLDISEMYEKEFKGMTAIPMKLAELLDARETLFAYIKSELSENERKFLYSIKIGEPDWDLIDINIEHVPAIQWKLLNIKKMDRTKHQAATDKLKSVLEL